MSEKTASLMASLTGDGAPATGGEDNLNPSSNGGDGEDLFGEIPIDDPPLAAAPAPMPAPAPAPANGNNNSDSIYHDSMSASGMQQQPPANFPYPQPPQPMANAPNITYADTSNPNPNANPSMAQSQPSLPSSAPAPAPAPAPVSKSLLMSSGLLGMAGGGSSDEKKADSGGGGGLFDDIDEEEEAKAKVAAAAAAAEEERQQQEAAAAAAAEKQRQEQEEQQRQQQMQQQQQQQLQQQQQMQQNQQAPPNQQQYSLEARMQGMHLNNGQSSYMQQSQQMPQPNTGNNQMMMNQQQQQPGQQGQMGGPNNQMQQQPGMQQQQPGQMMSNQQPGMQQQQQQPPSQISAPGVMYRDHGGMESSTMMNQSAASTGFADRSAAMMAPQQPQGPGGMGGPNSPNSPSRFYHPSTQGVANAGMHNSAMSPPQQPNSPYGGGGMQQQQGMMMRGQPIPITKPPDVPTYYGKVTINDPMLLQAPSKLFSMVSAPPHWSYQITTQILGQPPSVWMVRRRFRHVVALEDRLRQECPGAILPPRPDKHVSRAIEEASTNQSAEFAWQRAAELDTYLNALATHPEVFASQSLKMFLGLQDDMGTAWPEVSANAFTRMSAMGAHAAAKVQETSSSGFFGTAAPASTAPGQSGGVMSNVMGSVASSVGVGELAEAVTEDSAELLALASSESVRMGAVLQAVPKLEGAVTLLREQGEGAGAVGMELNRLAKEVLTQGDRELAMPLEIFSNGLLRYGRRTKRLGQEIGQATMSSYQLHYKLCRYEKLAWGDRRAALAKRTKERSKADKRAQQMMGYQQQYQSGYGGGYGGQPNMNQFNGGNQMNHMMNNAAMSDNMAVSAVHECDAVGERLKREVNRISYSRRMDWAKSVKVIASYMKEAATERVAIWESTRDTFLQTFPDYHNDTAQWTNVSSRMNMPQQSEQPQPQMNTNMDSSYMGQPGMMSQSYQQPMTQPQSQQPQAYNSMMASAMPGSAPVVGAYQQN